MSYLNLYAGLGGNRKLWGDCDVIAIEQNDEIASAYEKTFPKDDVHRADAHSYLLQHVDEYQFIWSSPPCPTHSKMSRTTRHALRRYPDFRLYEEIVFLQTYAKCPWVVENVRPYYKPLIEPTFTCDRHIFWANFYIPPFDLPPKPKGFINKCNLAGRAEVLKWLGMESDAIIYLPGNHCPAQVVRNCVHPLLGKHILDAAHGGGLPDEREMPAFGPRRFRESRLPCYDQKPARPRRFCESTLKILETRR